MNRLQGGGQLPAVHQARDDRVQCLSFAQILQRGRKLQAFHPIRTDETLF